ncbi:MAG: tail fiber domain-containing protein [Salinivirgaceae bacterium]|nr:tail fiber domain-containing protein [Salinivirgaceae bacterium]
MKKLFISTMLIALFSVTSLCQIRNQFKYQAVLRNNSGEVLSEQSVAIKISILKGSENGETSYSETHTVETNKFGLINLIIGTGLPNEGAFLNIAWGDDDYFLKLEVDIDGGSNYEVMGTSPLLSVPYSLHAESIGQMNQLSVLGDSESNLEEALFTVMNSTGDTVFAVYQEGVRIYVSDDNSDKALGSRGGFAVGGYSSGKGTYTNEYLRVTPDSVRIYVKNDVNKAIGSRGGFAVGGYSSGKLENSDFMYLEPENYFIGHESGINNTTGTYNAFLGYESGYNNTEGSENIFIGHGSGFSNTLGLSNVFVGNEAGFENIDGGYNVFVGNYAGLNNTTGSENVFIGDGAGDTNTIGNYNVFVGNSAGSENIDGSYNVFVGNSAGINNTHGEANVIIGDAAGESNTFGSSNVFVGDWAGAQNTVGEGNVYIGESSGWTSDSSNYNVFLGESTGYSNTKGSENVFLGSSTGFSNTEGNWNVFLGEETGYNNTVGEGNTFIGPNTGYSNIDGSENVFLGAESGYMNENGSNNVFLGPGAGYFETGSNKLYISGYDADSTESLVYGNFDQEVLQINNYLGVGKFPEENEMELEGDASKTTAGEWMANSDARIKTDIKDIDYALETIKKLHPVKFKYTKYWKSLHPSIEDKYYYNFIAQEYQKVFPESVKKGGDYLDESKTEKVLQQDSYNTQIISVKAIQELAKENEELRKMVQELTKRIERLENK